MSHTKTLSNINMNINIYSKSKTDKIETINHIISWKPFASCTYLRKSLYKINVHYIIYFFRGTFFFYYLQICILITFLVTRCLILIYFNQYSYFSHLYIILLFSYEVNILIKQWVFKIIWYIARSHKKA